jgi:hypothetical protein
MRVQPHGSFKNGFDLLDDSGAVVGSFSGSVWREGGRILVGGQEWEFRKDGGRRFELPGYAAAERTSMWSGKWSLSAGGRTYELAKESWLSRGYDVTLDGRTVGGINPRGWSERKADVSLPAELPPPVQVFTVAVVLTQWRRDSSSASVAAST